MSSSSTQPQPSGSARGATFAVGFGALLILTAVLGFIAHSLGLPFGFYPAASWAMAIAGIGLIIPAFVPFKAMQDYAGGVFLIVLATVGIAGTTGLNFHTTTGVGPGMMPRATGLIVAALGLIMIINSLFFRGEALTRWSIRGMVFVLGSALVFAWTIRPMGLVVAGPLAVIISAFADRDTKWIEVVTFAAIMTFACVALFSWGLKLPIPIWPTQSPYIPFVDAIKF